MWCRREVVLNKRLVKLSSTLFSRGVNLEKVHPSPPSTPLILAGSSFSKLRQPSILPHLQNPHKSSLLSTPLHFILSNIWFFPISHRTAAMSVSRSYILSIPLAILFFKFWTDFSAGYSSDLIALKVASIDCFCWSSATIFSCLLKSSSSEIEMFWIIWLLQI